MFFVLKKTRIVILPFFTKLKQLLRHEQTLDNAKKQFYVFSAMLEKQKMSAKQKGWISKVKKQPTNLSLRQWNPINRMK